MAKTWIYAASAAAIGGALIGGWLLDPAPPEASPRRSGEPTSELPSPLYISYSVFFFKKKQNKTPTA
ncbi:hypothetical protein LJG10_29625, partial [Pseudomonas aeruginosa]|nr:hypothetical protein [Pseudomonas aeruginosa]